MRALPRIVADTDIGKKVDVVVWREGKRASLSVTVGELPEQPVQAAAETPEPAPADTGTIDSLGLALSNLSEDVRRQFGLASSAEGVVISAVAPGSVADEKGLRPGDVILEVSQEPVSSPAKVAGMVADARKAGRGSVLMLVERDGNLRFVALKIS